MDQSKRDKQQGDQRQMDQGRNREARIQGDDRNQEDTGKPVQLDREGKEHQGGHPQQGGQPRKPEPEHKPDQGQHTGQRMP